MAVEGGQPAFACTCGCQWFLPVYKFHAVGQLTTRPHRVECVRCRRVYRYDSRADQMEEAAAVNLREHGGGAD